MRTTLHDTMITPVPSLGRTGMSTKPTAKPTVKIREARSGWFMAVPSGPAPYEAAGMTIRP
jgi:hypothetical protein